jgi:hypothetical protein
LGDPVHIPDATIIQFNTTFATALTAALANPSNWPNFNALLAAADIPLQLPGSDATLVGQTILRLLAYNVLFTNQAQQTLGGQPYDNVTPVRYDRPSMDSPPFRRSARTVPRWLTSKRCIRPPAGSARPW